MKRAARARDAPRRSSRGFVDERPRAPAPCGSGAAQPAPVRPPAYTVIGPALPGLVGRALPGLEVGIRVFHDRRSSRSCAAGRALVLQQELHVVAHRQLGDRRHLWRPKPAPERSTWRSVVNGSARITRSATTGALAPSNESSYVAVAASHERAQRAFEMDGVRGERVRGPVDDLVVAAADVPALVGTRCGITK